MDTCLLSLRTILRWDLYFPPPSFLFPIWIFSITLFIPRVGKENSVNSLPKMHSDFSCKHLFELNQSSSKWRDETVYGLYFSLPALQYWALGDMSIWLAAGFSRCFCLGTKSHLLLFERIVLELRGTSLSGDTSASELGKKMGCRGGVGVTTETMLQKSLLMSTQADHCLRGRENWFCILIPKNPEKEPKHLKKATHLHRAVLQLPHQILAAGLQGSFVTNAQCVRMCDLEGF